MGVHPNLLVPQLKRSLCVLLLLFDLTAATKAISRKKQLLCASLLLLLLLYVVSVREGQHTPALLFFLFMFSAHWHRSPLQALVLSRIHATPHLLFCVWFVEVFLLIFFFLFLLFYYYYFDGCTHDFIFVLCVGQCCHVFVSLSLLGFGSLNVREAGKRASDDGK
jgi:hypothetical protein